MLALLGSQLSAIGVKLSVLTSFSMAVSITPPVHVLVLVPRNVKLNTVLEDNDGTSTSALDPGAREKAVSSVQGALGRRFAIDEIGAEQRQTMKYRQSIDR